MSNYQPRLNGNGEVKCPFDGCPTGLQRSTDSDHVTGVLSHLKVVHFTGWSLEVLATKFRTQLDAIEEATSH